MNYLFSNDLPQNLEIKGDLAIDTEAMGLNIPRDRLCLLQLSNGDGNAYLIHFDGKDYSAPNLKKLLTDLKKEYIFHFARFDIAIIKYYLGIEVTNIFCTKIASKLVRTYTSNHGLKELWKDLLGLQLPKQFGTSYWGGKNLSKEQIDYAANDVLYLHKLRDILKDMLIASNRLELAYRVFNFLPVRTDLDLQGWSDTDIFAHSW